MLYQFEQYLGHPQQREEQQVLDLIIKSKELLVKEK